MPAVPPSTHSEHEDFAWTIAVMDHPARTDSPAYLASRKLMVTLAATLGDTWTFAPAPYEDHHGGGLWLRDDEGWLCLTLPLGIEWSAQFCADPAKVDRLRVQCARMVKAFPTTIAGYVEHGYNAAQGLLDTPITTAEQVAAWTDSIFNASVPLPKSAHTGTLPKSAGYHHYPKPIADIDHFRFDDFTLFVTDSAGRPAVVVPLAPRGSGDGRVLLLAAHPDSEHAAVLATSPVVDAGHDLARQAFARQETGV